MSKIEEKMKELGLELPVCPKPVGAFLPAQKAGKLIYASGQTAWINGKQCYQGKVGTDLTVEEGYESAKISAINCLSAIQLVEDLDNIRIVRVTGYVNGGPDFGKQPEVLNGASDLLLQLFGENGRHARSAIGVASLPTGGSVEVEIIAEVLEEK
ncbi:MAG: RidA family protein [Firmicutes bacterium]|nr:RidA family protein [Bacillota bacterium]